MNALEKAIAAVDASALSVKVGITLYSLAWILLDGVQIGGNRLVLTNMIQKSKRTEIYI